MSVDVIHGVCQDRLRPMDTIPREIQLDILAFHGARKITDLYARQTIHFGRCHHVTVARKISTQVRSFIIRLTKLCSAGTGVGKQIGLRCLVFIGERDLRGYRHLIESMCNRTLLCVAMDSAEKKQANERQMSNDRLHLIESEYLKRYI